jgi:hypothetical protein
VLECILLLTLLYRAQAWSLTAKVKKINVKWKGRFLEMNMIEKVQNTEVRRRTSMRYAAV